MRVKCFNGQAAKELPKGKEGMSENLTLLTYTPFCKRLSSFTVKNYSLVLFKVLLVCIISSRQKISV